MAEFRKSQGFGERTRGVFKKGGSGSRGASRGGFGAKPGFKRAGPGAEGGERTMYDAICSRCSKECQVPFRPNGEKPVLCRDCFRTDAPAGSGERQSSGYPKRDFGAPAFTNPAPRGDAGMADLKKQLELVNIKLDKLIQILKETSEE